ncbi:MAG: iron-containing alcohol dehydrogenase [Actinobacteria bacterium]|nr:iron-containing alcohol dehydrogenase [Actinomycetota bacterium]
MVLDSRRWDARYGRGLLAEHGVRYRSYLAITSPSAWKVVQPHLPHPPVALEFHRGMGERYLEALLPRLPEAAHVLAIGGGNALDVGKYVAWKRQQPLVMIPTIVSTGAVFQSPIAIRRADIWDFQMETVAPEILLFDVDVIRAAPPHLNCGGMAECVCQTAAVGAWRWWTARGLEGHPFDPAAAEVTLTWARDRCTAFAHDLDASGQPGATGIRIAAEINRERYDLPTAAAAGGNNLDHTFAMTFEWVHGRELLHAEAVALGTLMNAYLYAGGFDEAKALLDACRVRYRPPEIGCTEAEIRQVLQRFNELSDRLGRPRNWFHLHRLDDATFARMLAAINA